jgi:hypothetical protein
VLDQVVVRPINVDRQDQVVLPGFRIPLVNLAELRSIHCFSSRDSSGIGM